MNCGGFIDEEYRINKVIAVVKCSKISDEAMVVATDWALEFSISVYRTITRSYVIGGGWVGDDQWREWWKKIAYNVAGLSRREFELNQVWMAVIHLLGTIQGDLWTFSIDLDAIRLGINNSSGKS